MLKTFSLVLALGLLVVAAAGIDWFFGQRMTQSVEGVVSGVKPNAGRTENAQARNDVPSAEIAEGATPQLLSASPVGAPRKPKIQITEADLPHPPQPAAVRALSDQAEHPQDQTGRLQALRALEPSPVPAVVPVPDPAPPEPQEQTTPVEVVIPAEPSAPSIAPVISRHPELKPKSEPALHPSVPHEHRITAPRPTRVATTRDSGGREIGARGPVRAEPPPQNIIEREFQRWRRCDGKWGKTRDCLAYEHDTKGGG